MRAPVLLSIVLCIAAAPVVAQTRVEVAPTVGLYIPSGNVVDQPGAGCGGCQVTFSQQAGFLIGARLTIWPSGGRLGLETSIGMAFSGVHGVAVGYGSGDTSGTVGIFTERVLWAFTKPGAGTAIYGAGGVAYLLHTSDAYQGLSGTSDLGLALGLGGLFPLGGGVALKTELEDLIYSTQFEAGGQSTESKHQNDFVLSLGLSIHL